MPSLTLLLLITRGSRCDLLFRIPVSIFFQTYPTPCFFGSVFIIHHVDRKRRVLIKSRLATPPKNHASISVGKERHACIIRRCHRHITHPEHTSIGYLGCLLACIRVIYPLNVQIPYSLFTQMKVASSSYYVQVSKHVGRYLLVAFPKAVVISVFSHSTDMKFSTAVPLHFATSIVFPCIFWLLSPSFSHCYLSSSSFLSFQPSDALSSLLLQRLISFTPFVSIHSHHSQTLLLHTILFLIP